VIRQRRSCDVGTLGFGLVGEAEGNNLCEGIRRIQHMEFISVAAQAELGMQGPATYRRFALSEVKVVFDSK
jgi:hypothetical protein